MRFCNFHLMPWPHLPDSYDGPAWVTCPNALYEPVEGGRLYNRYIDELVRAEALAGRPRRITATTLVLSGDHDGIVGRPYAERWASLVPDARLQRIERCGHLPPVEPEAFADAAVRFLGDERA